MTAILKIGAKVVSRLVHVLTSAAVCSLYEETLYMSLPSKNFTSRGMLNLEASP